MYHLNSVFFIFSFLSNFLGYQLNVPLCLSAFSMTSSLLSLLLRLLTLLLMNGSNLILLCHLPITHTQLNNCSFTKKVNLTNLLTVCNINKAVTLYASRFFFIFFFLCINQIFLVTQI